MNGPLRSVLFVPASRPAMLAKIGTVPADAVIVELEDGVAPGDKVEARDRVLALHASGALEGARWMLRINAPGTAWHLDDLEVAAIAAPTAVLLPKAETTLDVQGLAEEIAAHGSAVALMIETARGVANVRELASAHPAVRVLVYGASDLRRSLGAREDPERRWEAHAMGAILVAARANGALAVDAVYSRPDDDAGFRRHAAIARGAGYDGKTCIHPSQVAAANETFSSSLEELAWARRVLDAWREEDGEGRGVIVVDGEMIEALHVAMARRIVTNASSLEG